MKKLHDFFVKNRKLVSVCGSVVFSILIVVVIVHGATTIGTYIATGGDINASGTLLVDGNINASGTLSVTGNASTTQIAPWANNTSDLGSFSHAWKDIYASGTIFAGTYSAGSIGTSTFTGMLAVSGVGTSTFAGTLDVTKASATTTFNLGGSGAAGAGGCISWGSTTGVGNLYLYVAEDGSGDVYLATSTDQKSCY